MRDGPYLHLGVGRDGWRMASEDSRNRDGLRKFIVSARPAMYDSPSTVRWWRWFIIRTTVENFSNSRALAVLSGFCSKNGMMRWVRSARDLTDHRHMS